MELLSLGTIVILKNGGHKLMITVRVPLKEENGEIGYYDYGAVLYPEGQMDQKTYFFNTEDIEEVVFEGYCDERELEYKKLYEEKKEEIGYPHFKVVKN